MAANTDYEEFVAFVAAAESDLRYASNLAVGDPSTSRLLMRKALARTAQRWRLARADDPHRFLLNAIESEANTLWRVEDPDPDLEVGSVDTALSLADEAWDEGLRLRARRRRNVAVAVGVIALLVGAYLWSAEESESAQSATDPVAGRVTPLEDGFVALPPLPLLEESPRLRDDIPAVLDVSEAAPLSEDPVDAIALAVQTTLGEQLAVLGDDGGVRVVDVASDQKGWRLFPRAVSPAADRVVLAGETQIRVVDSSGGIQDIDQDAAGLPPNVTDLAWFPDGEHLLATFEAESYSVDAESGESEPLNWHGSVSTFHPDTGDTVEFSSAGDDLVLQTWQGGDPTGEAYRAAEGALPIQTWRREAPFADASGFYVRACELREDFEVPPEYGEARECLAAVDAEASVLSVLALADVDVTSSVNLVVGTGGGKVFFAVPAGGPEQLLLAWTPADDTLRLVTTVTDPVAVGLL